MGDKLWFRDLMKGYVANLVGGLLILTLALVFSTSEWFVWALGVLCTVTGAAGVLTYVYDTKGE